MKKENVKKGLCAVGHACERVIKVGAFVLLGAYGVGIVVNLVLDHIERNEKKNNSKTHESKKH